MKLCTHNTEDNNHQVELKINMNDITLRDGSILILSFEVKSSSSPFRNGKMMTPMEKSILAEALKIRKRR